MTHVTRRTAVGLGAVSLAVATAQVASALPSADPGGGLLPGGQVPVKNLGGAVPSPISSVRVSEQNLALSLEFTGNKIDALTDGEQTRDVVVHDVPTSLVLANIGGESIPTGTRVTVRSANLDAAGLVTGAKQPVLVRGVTNDARTWLVIAHENGGTVLTLCQALPSGCALTADLAWELSSGTVLEGAGKVQVLASAALVTGGSNYYEAQAPEVILSF